MDKVIDLNTGHWVCIYAKLSPKNKKFLGRYFSTLYPREYVRKLISALREPECLI